MTEKSKLQAYVAEIHADWRVAYSGKHPRMYLADEVDAAIERLTKELDDVRQANGRDDHPKR
jgi:hypothetical protein